MESTDRIEKSSADSQGEEERADKQGNGGGRREEGDIFTLTDGNGSMRDTGMRLELTRQRKSQLGMAPHVKSVTSSASPTRADGERLLASLREKKGNELERTLVGLMAARTKRAHAWMSCQAGSVFSTDNDTGYFERNHGKVRQFTRCNGPPRKEMLCHGLPGR